MIPNWFDNWDPADPSLQKIVAAGVFLPLQGYDRLGRYCILVRMGQVSSHWLRDHDAHL